MTQKPKILALWAVLRSVSTAFVRMMIERNDFYVFNSSFSVYYYYSKNRVSDRYGAEPKNADDFDYQQVLSTLHHQPTDKPVFLKDMAYYVKECMNPQFLDNFNNTFIIRHPLYSLPSLQKIMPDFTLEETGYEQQYRMFQMVQKYTGTAPIVIDGTELRENPEAVIKTYCHAVGIPFIPQALNWQPKKELPQMTLWQEWYGNVNSSTGFVPLESDNSNEVVMDDQVLKAAYHHCLPFYEEMRKYKLTTII